MLAEHVRSDLVALIDKHGYEDVLNGIGTLLDEQVVSLRGNPMLVALVADAAQQCRDAAISYYVSTK